MKIFSRILVITGIIILIAIFPYCGYSNEVSVVTPAKPVEETGPLARPLGNSGYTIKKSTKKSTSTKRNLPKFKGVGSKNGKFDTGFRKETKKHSIMEEESSGISLPSGVQNVVDRAGEILDDIDESTLNTVKGPLQALGLEAESAQLRPSGGGVGLGISIRLDKKKKTEQSEKDQKDKSRKKVYTLLGPKDTITTDTTTH